MGAVEGEVTVRAGWGGKGARGDGRDVARGHRPAWGEKLWVEQRGEGTGVGTGEGTGVGRDGSRLRGVQGNKGEIPDSRALPRRTRFFEECGTRPWGVGGGAESRASEPGREEPRGD